MPFRKLVEALFYLALLGYSLAIISHKAFGRMKRWMLIIFAASFACDLGGTIFLCVAMAKRWEWNLHSSSGLLAVVLMGSHLILGLLAYFLGGKWERWFNKFSMYTWFIWVVSFVTGIPLRPWIQVLIAISIYALGGLYFLALRLFRKD